MLLDEQGLQVHFPFLGVNAVFCQDKWPPRPVVEQYAQKTGEAGGHRMECAGCNRKLMGDCGKLEQWGVGGFNRPKVMDERILCVIFVVILADLPPCPVAKKKFLRGKAGRLP